MSKPEEIACSRCGEIKPSTEFHKSKRSPSGIRSYCRSCAALYRKEWSARPGNGERELVNSRAWHLAIKLEGLRHYGGVCACCGEADIRFLTFDHIDGGGNQHRAEVVGSLLVRWLRRSGWPSGFQILCFNCNSGRSVNGGVCPHQDPDGRIVC